MRTDSILEASHSFIDNRLDPDSHSFPEVLLRRGISERLELPNGWEWTTAMRYGTGFEEEDAFNQWAPSTVVKIPVGDR